jgi:hypothetical protein
VKATKRKSNQKRPIKRKKIRGSRETKCILSKARSEAAILSEAGATQPEETDETDEEKEMEREQKSRMCSVESLLLLSRHAVGSVRLIIVRTRLRIIQGACPVGRRKSPLADTERISFPYRLCDSARTVTAHYFARNQSLRHSPLPLVDCKKERMSQYSMQINIHLAETLLPLCICTASFNFVSSYFTHLPVRPLARTILGFKTLCHL